MRLHAAVMAILMLTATQAWAQDGWTTLVLSTAGNAAGDHVQPVAVRVRSFNECPLAISIDWRNPGAAPVDGVWRTRLWVKAGDTMNALPARSEKDLPSVMPGETVTEDNCFALPAGMAAGRYDLYVQVADPRTERTMALPLNEGDGDNRYLLGAVSIR